MSEQSQLAEAIRAACVQAALDGFEDASMSGLCRHNAAEEPILACAMGQSIHLKSA